MKTELTYVEPHRVVIMYFYRDSTTTGLSPMQVSWDDGATWNDLEATTDKAGAPAFKLVASGPEASPPSGHILSATGMNYGIVRQVDTPEIDPHYFHLPVRKAA